MNNQEVLFNLTAMVRTYANTYIPDEENPVDALVDYGERLVRIGVKVLELEELDPKAEITPEVKKWLQELLDDGGTIGAFLDTFPYKRISAGLKGLPEPTLDDYDRTRFVEHQEWFG